ncbi:MAG: MerR family DNA-binding transcriptional regulator, partial [Candidatus Chisholmbacteria bacterium]|nr:MerR family DNA-binding transcriptional regulator [Candidatus Chisholmbacteria bacterium]
MIPKNLLSVGEVSQKLGVSISTLRRWDNLGKLTSLRTPGNQRRYRQEQISAFLKGDKGNKGSQGDIAERTPEPFPVPSRQHPVPSRVLTFPDPHQLLYAALAAIVTVQLLHLAILKVPALKVGVDFAATTTLEGISSILGARTQEKQDVNGTTQEKIPVLSSDNPVPSRVLLSTFTHAFLKSALYSGTHYYQSFAQKTNTVSTQGTYLLASTAVAAAK